jgi:hypothetical protein
VAAAAAAIFLKYERSRALEQEERATSVVLKNSPDPATGALPPKPPPPAAPDAAPAR